jgi:predicted Zn-dependent protease
MAAPPLKSLKADLDRELKKGDWDKVAAARAAIVAAYPETEEGAEASYKLALDAIYRKKNLEEAANHLRNAVKVKSPWSGIARSTLGIVLLRQGKAQQAAFELRRVAGQNPPTIFSASAQGLLVIALRETNQPKEAERARAQHKQILAKLTQSATPEDAAMANFLLGMEYKFDGERDIAKRHLAAAIESKKLPNDERAIAERALSEL